MDRYAIVTLKTHHEDEFILLSYPGMETNGTIVVAPLVPEDRIGIVETLHPIVDTPRGRRVVAVERMAGVARDLVQDTPHSLIEYEFRISGALSRLFYGN